MIAGVSPCKSGRQVFHVFCKAVKQVGEKLFPAFA